MGGVEYYENIKDTLSLSSPVQFVSMRMEIIYCLPINEGRKASPSPPASLRLWIVVIMWLLLSISFQASADAEVWLATVCGMCNGRRRRSEIFAIAWWDTNKPNAWRPLVLAVVLILSPTRVIWSRLLLALPQWASWFYISLCMWWQGAKINWPHTKCCW